MLNINIICVGKIKEKYLKEAIDEYSKRLSKYCKLNLTEVSHEKIPDKLYPKLEQDIKEKECNKILNNIKKDSFIIGGSLGLTKELLERCNYKLCFSKMTFPHQLIRVFLLEQIFRAFKIQNGETYHR